MSRVQFKQPIVFGTHEREIIVSSSGPDSAGPAIDGHVWSCCVNAITGAQALKGQLAR